MDLFYTLDNWYVHLILLASLHVSFFYLNNYIKIVTKENGGDGFDNGYSTIYIITIVCITNGLDRGDLWVFLPHGITIFLQAIFLFVYFYDKTENKIDFYQYLLYSLFPITLIGLFFI